MNCIDTVVYTFQSTHLRRCDFIAEPIDTVVSVSNHAPTKVRLRQQMHRLNRWRFNPRTYEGATNQSSPYRRTFCVSIHAPTKVRLWYSFCPLSSNTVSIHAPTKVRLIGCNARNALQRFQSTHLRRCDDGHRGGDILRGVSIHAPTKVRLSHS